MVRHYAFEDIVCVLAGIPIVEYAEGDSLVITRPQKKKYEKSQGSHGSVMRSKMYTNLAEIKVVTMFGSPINELLQALEDLDETTGLGTGEFFVQDPNGTSLCVAPQCWIEEPPDMTFGQQAGSLEWMFGAGNLIMHHGQNRLVV